MDTIWHTLQAKGDQAAFATAIFLAGLYGLRRRNWARQKQKFLREFNMSPAEVEILFKPTHDVLYRVLQVTGSASMAIGGSIFLYGLFFAAPPAAGEILVKILSLCFAVFFVCLGALLAFRSETMRQIARLSNLDYFRPGRSWRKSLFGDPTAKRPLVNSYTRYRGIVMFIIGLVLAYGALRHVFPGLPKL